MQHTHRLFKQKVGRDETIKLETVKKDGAIMSDPNLVGNPQSVPLCKCKLNTLDPHFLGKPYTYVINSDCEEFNIPKDPA